MTEQDYQKLIPLLRTAKDGQPFEIECWLDWIGEPTHAVAYSTLFWPEFIECEGCVFWGVRVPARYQEWKKEFQCIISDIEGMLNHMHFGDLFTCRKENWTNEQVLFIGRVLKDSWSAKLKRDFPAKEFTVEFNEDFNYETDDPTITFYQSDRTLKTTG